MPSMSVDHQNPSENSIPKDDNDELKLNFYEKLTREFSAKITKKIKKSVISYFKARPAVTLADTGLINEWEEVCVIIEDGNSALYDPCIEFLDSVIGMHLEGKGLAEWQLTAVWIQTAEGDEWLQKKDKDDQINFAFDLRNIVTHIRDEYLVPAALNFSNKRIEKYKEAFLE